MLVHDHPYSHLSIQLSGCSNAYQPYYIPLELFGPFTMCRRGFSTLPALTTSPLPRTSWRSSPTLPLARPSPAADPRLEGGLVFPSTSPPLPSSPAPLAPRLPQTRAWKEVSKRKNQIVFPLHVPSASQPSLPTPHLGGSHYIVFVFAAASRNSTRDTRQGCAVKLFLK